MEVHMLPRTLSVARKPMGVGSTAWSGTDKSRQMEQTSAGFSNPCILQGHYNTDIYHELATLAFAAAVPTVTEQTYG